MAKYRSKAKWDEDLECEIDEPRPILAIESEDGVPTGILDAHGNELFRYEKVKAGYLAMKRRKGKK